MKHVEVDVIRASRGEKPDQGQMLLEEFIQRCEQEIATRGVAHATAAAS